MKNHKLFGYVCAILLVLSGKSYSLNVNGHQSDSVLSYFNKTKSDSLKLRAAKFLLDNMPIHASYQGERIHLYSRLVRNTRKPIGRNTLKELAQKSKDCNDQIISRISDTVTISAEYLIQHINGAFKAWYGAPWRDEVDFVHFCHYILPYRIENESVGEYWIDSLRGRYANLVEGVTDIKQAYSIIIKNVEDSFRLLKPNFQYTLDVLTLDNLKSGLCSDKCILQAAVLRSLGIPAVYDYVSSWTNYSQSGHSWISLILSDTAFNIQQGDILPASEKNIPASIISSEGEVEPGYLYRVDTLKRVCKVYRRNFKKELDADVSDEYGITSSLNIDMPLGSKGTIYLCVFETGNDWIPVSKSEIKDDKCTFGNIGANSIYLLMQQANMEMSSLSDPFLLMLSGKLRAFRPDLKKSRQIVLHRKYPLFGHWYSQWRKMIGGKIEAANDPEFNGCDTIAQIAATPIFCNTLKNTSRRKYRYVRYVCPENCRTPVAELQVLAKDNIQLDGVPMGSSSLTEQSRKNAFDGKLTTVTSTKSQYWVGLDLSTPHEIEKIIFYPKNDGNFIEINNNYELFYYDQGWVSLGKQKASYHQLTFRAPENALLLLQNANTGKEERIFIYENGKQVWF